MEESDIPAKSEVLKRFGATLRAMRTERGLSQEDLAHVVGLDRTYIGGAERGERNVSLHNLVKLSRALDVHVSELLKEVDE